MNYIITALILLGYELNIFYKLKPLFGYDKHKFKKPFDCFLCLSFWGNTLTTITIIIIKQKICINDLAMFSLCIILTKIIDILINK